MDLYKPRPRESALERLQAYILDHHLQPGDRLPPERELCRAWGFNRTTLRNAIARLEASGQLSAVQGSGTRIVHRLRRTLDNLHSFTEASVSSGFQPETTLLSFSKIPCDTVLASHLKRQPGDKLYRICRLRSLDGEPLMIEDAYVPYDLAPGLDPKGLENGSLFQNLRESCNLELNSGIVSISLTHVTQEEATLLRLNPDAFAYCIISETAMSDGSPAEYCRAIGRGDRLEFACPVRLPEERRSAT